MSIQQVRRSILVAAAFVAVAGMGLFAGRIFGGQVVPGMGHGGPRAQHMFEHLANKLDLTPDQRTKVRAVLKTHADEILAQVQAGQDARQALHEAVMAQPPDENVIRSLAAKVGEVHGNGALLIVKVRSEIWPILTPEQQQKFVAFHERMSQRNGEALQSLGAFLRGEN